MNAMSPDPFSKDADDDKNDNSEQMHFKLPEVGSRALYRARQWRRTIKAQRPSPETILPPLINTSATIPSQNVLRTVFRGFFWRRSGVTRRLHCLFMSQFPWDAEAHRGWVVGLCPQRQEGRCGGQLNFTALVLLLASPIAQRRHPPDDIQFDNTVLVYLLPSWLRCLAVS